MSRTNRYSDVDVAAAVAASHSIAGVMRQLGITPAGGSHANISGRIKRMGLDTRHFTGQAHNRGKTLPRTTAEHFLKRHAVGSRRIEAKYLRRSMIELGVEPRCTTCGTSTVWMRAPLILHVDHIDGDRWNCELSNLRFLCPNCHSQTPTFCRGSLPQQPAAPSHT
jgi:5-methylcytosine-specific restriction endonuclease McrA